ncbi:hypothetical protein DSUL_20018 [Desulfovibrionales bacterium]
MIPYRALLIILLLVFAVYLAKSCNSNLLSKQTDQSRQGNTSVTELQAKIVQLEKDLDKSKSSHDKWRQKDELIIAECRSMYNAASVELNRTKEQLVELSKEFADLKYKHKKNSSELSKFKERPVESESADVLPANSRTAISRPGESVQSPSLLFPDQPVNESRKANCIHKADQLNLVDDERKQYINGCLQR